MDIIYPINCKTPKDRTEYLYRAQELLRELHNTFSKWLHEGLSQDEYNSLPGVIQAKYPYFYQITNDDWDKFKDEDFDSRSNKICQEICVQRAELKKSKEWPVDIGSI